MCVLRFYKFVVAVSHRCMYDLHIQDFTVHKYSDHGLRFNSKKKILKLKKSTKTLLSTQKCSVVAAVDA